MPNDLIPSSFNSSIAAANSILEDDAIMADAASSGSMTITTKLPFLSLNNDLRQSVFSFFSLTERARFSPVSTTIKKDIDMLSEKFFDEDKNKLIKLLCSGLSQNLPPKLSYARFLKKLYELSLRTETENFEKITILLYLIKYRQQYPTAFTVAQINPKRLLQEFVFYSDDYNYIYVSLKLIEILSDKEFYEIRLNHVIDFVIKDLIGDSNIDLKAKPLANFFPALEKFLSMYSFNTSSTIVHQFIKAFFQNINLIRDVNDSDEQAEYFGDELYESYFRKCGQYLNIKDSEFLWSQWNGAIDSASYYLFDSALDNMRESSQRAPYLERLCQRFLKISDWLEHNEGHHIDIGEFAILSKYLFEIPMHYLEQIVMTLKKLLQNRTNTDIKRKYVSEYRLHNFIKYLIKSTNSIKSHSNIKPKIDLISTISEEIISFAIAFPDEPSWRECFTAFDRNKLIFESQIISSSQRERMQPILKSSFEKKNRHISWAFAYKNVQADDQNKPAVPDEEIAFSRSVSEWKELLPLIANYLSFNQISRCLCFIYSANYSNNFKEELALCFILLSSISHAQRKKLLKKILKVPHTEDLVIPNRANFYHFSQTLPKKIIDRVTSFQERVINLHVLYYYLYYFSNSIEESRTIFSAIFHCYSNKINPYEAISSSNSVGSNSLDDFEYLAKPVKLFIEIEAAAILKNIDNYQNTIKAEQKSYLISALLSLVEKGNELLTRIIACTFLTKFSAALSYNQINQLIHTILEDNTFPTKFALVVLPKFINTSFPASQQLIFAERLNRFTIKSYQDLALYSDSLYSLETMKSLRSDIDLNSLKLKVDQFIMKKLSQESIPVNVNLRYISTSLLTTINSEKPSCSEASAILRSLLKVSHKRNVEERELVDDNPSKKLKPF